MPLERSATASHFAWEAGIPWYGAEFITSGGYAFSLISCWALFPTEEFAASHLASLHAGVSKDVAVLAPAILLGLATCVFAMSAISRCPTLGHPLIAVGLWINGRLSLRALILAVTFQFLGAIGGAFFARAFFAEELALYDSSLLTYSTGYQLGQAALFEIGSGFLLVWSLFSFASLQTSVGHRQSALSIGILFGMVTALLSIVGRYLTVGIANPAMAIGIMIATYSPVDLIVFVVAPTLGGTSAAFLAGRSR